jgi:polyribonucleotide nucleotidyltransferase
MARGDVLDVVVQEVDKERGRIGLKLVAKHENGGTVSPEELIERAKDAPPREDRGDDRPRGGDRGRGGGRGGRGGGGRDRERRD